MTDPQPGPTLPAGFTVLLVEDNPLIAMDSAAILEAAGAATVVIAATVAEAIRLLAGQTFDAALIDVLLGSERSDAVADELVRGAIPFAYVTGYTDVAGIAPRYADRPVLGKPFAPEQLVALLERIVHGP